MEGEVDRKLKTMFAQPAMVIAPLREAAHYSCFAVLHSCPVLRGPMQSRHRS